jgi:hypothetical protein
MAWICTPEQKVTAARNHKAFASFIASLRQLLTFNNGHMNTAGKPCRFAEYPGE